MWIETITPAMWSCGSSSLAPTTGYVSRPSFKRTSGTRFRHGAKLTKQIRGSGFDSSSSPSSAES